MVTNVAPYCAIHGYDFTSIVYVGGIDPSGGGIGVEEITTLARDYADIRVKGRQPKKYKITVGSTDREEIEAFLEEVNTAPEDAEFYPFEENRFGLIASSYATLKAPKIWKNQYNRYEAEAVITCREPWLRGPDDGISLERSVTLPASSAIENEGHERASVDYIQMSGRTTFSAFPVPVDISSRSGDDMAIACDAACRIYFSLGHCWTLSPTGLAKKVSMSAAGVVVVGTDDYPWRLAEGAWSRVSSVMTVTDISIAEDGTIYGVHAGKVYRMSGEGWTDLGGVVTAISAKNSTTVYGLSSSDSSVWYYDGSWHQLNATAVQDVSVDASGNVFALIGGEAYWWKSSGPNWQKFTAPGTGLTKISGTSFTTGWAMSSASAWRYDSITPAWVPATWATADWARDISCRIALDSAPSAVDRKILLCDMLLGNDRFEVGRQGEIWHSWQAAMSKSLSSLAIDIHGLISGGSIADSVMTLDNGDYLMIPFYGPLPVSGDPGSAYVELQVDAITGDGATVQVALESDLVDMTEVEHDDLVVGLNTIYIPDLEGEGLVVIGIKAAASGSVALSGINAMVKRYVAPQQIPWADPGESASIYLEGANGAKLGFLEVVFNNLYYY